MTITKYILDLEFNLTIGKLLVLTLAIKIYLIKDITKGTAI